MMKCEELHNNLARLMFVLSLQERLGRAFLVVGTLPVLVFGCLTDVLVERTLEHVGSLVYRESPRLLFTSSVCCLWAAVFWELV